MTGRKSTAPARTVTRPLVAQHPCRVGHYGSAGVGLNAREQAIFDLASKHAGRTLTRSRLRALSAILAGASLLAAGSSAQAQMVPWATTLTANDNATTLPEDRGADGLAQTLNKLRTWASLMMIVAHPDDEDGGMMALESRGAGTRTALLTLTRGEGGQNAMSSETYDALGLMRTNELLAADAYTGTEQFWGRFADYGFSKTKEEAFSKWGHDKVLYDVVHAIRLNHPLVLTSVFLGGITDGHGHHQVSGEITQEAFNAAGDPSVFPDQIAAGLAPWKPLKVYERQPFSSITARGMFDYATGHWAPPHFYNYVTSQASTTVPTIDVSVPEGTYDPILGRSYLQMAREGWGLQKSQYGGGTPPLAGPNNVGYHLYGSRVANTGTAASATPGKDDTSFFSGIDTSLPGLATLAHGDTAFLVAGLRGLDRTVTHAFWGYTPAAPEKIAPDLRDGYLQTRRLMEAVTHSTLSEEDKRNVNHELAIKLVQFNTALAEALGLELSALVTPTPRSDASGIAPRVLSINPEETATHVTPGEEFDIRVHVTSANTFGPETGSGNTTAGKLPLHLGRTWLTTPESEAWPVERVATPGLDRGSSQVGDAIFRVSVPQKAAPTKPYFSRPTIEQPYYDIHDPRLLGRSFAPYPVSGWAEFDYGGVPVRVGQTVQSAHRVHGAGLLYEPLVVTPQLSVELPEQVAVLPLGQTSLSVTASVTNEQAEKTDATLALKLPDGWRATPASAALHLAPGETRQQQFTLNAGTAAPSEATASYSISASAQSGNSVFTSGFQSVGYPGLRPYNLYRAAQLEVRPVDVHVTPGVRVGYVMGTGDTVPDALEELGVHPTLLTPEALLTGDLSRYDTILLGVRTYTARPELAQANARLLAWVHAGGTLVVQYQDPAYDHDFGPYPYSLGSLAERVVDERDPVRLLAPADPLLSTPNKITPSDFDGWVEERGHGFLTSWDPRYTALTETADPDEAPQHSGLLVANYGAGRYIYMAFALHRQLPEGVPGAFRLLANLVGNARAQTSGQPPAR